jgi:hypothetical protein
MPFNKQLESLSKILLQSDNPGVLRNTVHQFHDLYSSLCGINAGDITDDTVFLSTGKAISPISAAHCLLEYKRTAVFFRGVYKAVLSIQNNFPREKINILYAGSGPYASLVTPLTSFFTEEELCFDILDINPVSLDAVKSLYTKLGLLGYVNNFIEADATKYRIEENRVIHIVISETMNRTLEKEPLVHIMQNLIPQMKEKGVFIPQSVKITACVSLPEKAGMSLADEILSESKSVGDVYTVTRAECRPEKRVIIKIPEDVKKDRCLYLLTTIDVFDDEELKVHDCSLTLPKFISTTDGHAGKRVKFEYIPDELPRFVYEII